MTLVLLAVGNSDRKAIFAALFSAPWAIKPSAVQDLFVRKVATKHG